MKYPKRCFCRTGVRPCSACMVNLGYRDGLLKAARMASARAGKKIGCIGCDDPKLDWLNMAVCRRCLTLRLAADLRKLAKEDS